MSQRARARLLVLALVTGTVVSLVATAGPGQVARAGDGSSMFYFPWVPHDELIAGQGPWFSEVSYQNLSDHSCPVSVQIGSVGSWENRQSLSVLPGGSRSHSSESLLIPAPGAPVRLVAPCPISASVKLFTPDVDHGPWSDGAAVVTGYTGVADADMAVALSSPTSGWFLPIVQTNSGWNTLIRLANFSTDVGADVTVELYPAGNIFGSQGAELVLTERLAVAEAWTIDVLAELGQADWVGYARIITGGEVAVSALRTKPSAAMALTNVAVAADAASAADVHLAAAPLLFTAYNGWNTGINLANIADEVADVRVRYFATGGELVREEQLYLLPRSMQYIYTPGNVDQEGFVGSATIVSTTPVVAAIDEVKYESTEGLSYIAGMIGQTDASIPVAFREDPNNGRHDNSGINVSNLNQGSPQTVEISLVSIVGTDILPEPVLMEIPAGGSNFVYLPFIPGFPAGTQASIRIRSDDPIGFVAISNDVNYAVSGDGSVVFVAASNAGYYHYQTTEPAGQ